MNFKFVPKETIILPMNPETEAKKCVRVLAEELLKNAQHISCAESCTGGLVAKCITDVPGSSSFFECGVVSYSSRIKCEVLGVDDNIIRKYGVVSAETAARMAERIREISGADLGIGITGVAGPGADGDKPEGNIFISLSTPTETYVLELNTGAKDQREYNRNVATLNAFNLALNYLTGKLD